MIRSFQVLQKNDDYCKDCETRLIPKNWEKLCTNCGLIEEDNIDFINIANYKQINQGTAVYAHQANERQTLPMYQWNRGRFKILIKKMG